MNSRRVRCRIFLILNLLDYLILFYIERLLINPLLIYVKDSFPWTIRNTFLKRNTRNLFLLMDFIIMLKVYGRLFKKTRTLTYPPNKKCLLSLDVVKYQNMYGWILKVPLK